MINVDSGTASRFVTRKYFGKVPKISQTAGPVKSWHEMDRAAVSHRRFRGFLPFPGYQSFIFG